MPVFNRLKLLIAVFIVFNACGGDDKSGTKGAIPPDTADTSLFSTPSDPGNATSQEVESFLSEDSFKAHAQKAIKQLNMPFSATSTAQNTPEDDEVGNGDCLDVNSAKVEAQGENLSIKTVNDFKDCLSDFYQQISGEVSFKISAAYFGINMKVTCGGANFSDLDGKPLSQISDEGDLSGIDSLCTTGNMTMYVNLQSKVVFTASGQGGSSSVNSETRFIMANPQGGACTATKSGSTQTLSDCIEVNFSTSTQTANDQKETENEYQKIVFENVVKSIDGQQEYFTSGTQNVVYRDWTGTVTHNGTGFSYEFSSGTDSITGTKP